MPVAAFLLLLLLNGGIVVLIWRKSLLQLVIRNGQKILPLALQWLYQLNAGLRTADTRGEQPYFELTPSDDIDNEKIYADRLQWALDHPYTTNIAITGPYGSGKSSIIKTFQKKHPQYGYLNVSLASFKDEEKAKNIPMDVIEVSILQQIFYHVTHETIAGSRFSRIKKISPVKLILRSVGVLLMMICLVLIIKPDGLNYLPWWPAYLNANRSAIFSAATLMALAIFITALYALFKLYSDQKLEKINVKNLEVALAPKSEASILNKNLDEILYFFEVTRYNVVILEDLDRFNNPDIFSKLREVNNLINNAQEVSRKVTFIYALKDDIFTDEPRTKFFDFIIPVIPVINVSNSSEVLLKWRENHHLEKTVSARLIRDIGLYIDDMRLLKNIFNEFLLYRQLLKGFAVKDDQILALIVYKNKNPQDFSELYNNRGHVAGLFLKRTAYINQLGLSIREKINNHRKLIRKAETEVPKKVEELRAIYLHALLKKANKNFTHLRDTGGNWIPIYELHTDQNFNLLINENPLRYLNQGRYSSDQGVLDFTFSDVEKDVSAFETYQDRLDLLNETGGTKLETLKKEVDKWDNELQTLNKLSIRQVVEQMPGILSDEFFVNNPLLAHLIRYGYINENYTYYISQFHEGSLTRIEYDFLVSVRNRQPKDFDFSLTRILPLIEELRPEELERTEILNSNLFDVIWTTNTGFQKEKKVILKQFENPDDRALAFIDHHLQNSTKLEYFFNDLAGTWKEMWDYMDKKAAASEEKKDKYLLLLLEYASLEHVEIQNTSLALQDYIARKRNLLEITKDRISNERLFAVINHLDTLLEDVELPDTDLEFATAIYAESLYVLNPMMIRQMLALFGQLSPVQFQHLEKAHYTVIRHSKAESLQAYVKDNLKDYVEETLLRLENDIEEDQSLILDLLNSDKISVSLKKQLVDRQPLTVAKIDAVEEWELWPKLLEQKKVKADWENIWDCYAELEGFTVPLTSFLNDKPQYEALGLSKIAAITDKVEKNAVEEFTVSLVLHNELSDAAYSWLLQSVEVQYGDLEFSQLTPSKVGKLIQRRILMLTTVNFNRAKAFNQDIHIQLIHKNPDVFLQNMKDFSLRPDEYRQLLSIDLFTQDEQLTIAAWLDPAMYDGQPHLAEAVAKIFIRNNRHTDASALTTLLANLENKNTKVELLVTSISMLTTEQISDALRKIGSSYTTLIELNRAHYLEENELNKSLLLQLKNKAYISSFHSNGKNEFKVNAKKSRD